MYRVAASRSSAGISAGATDPRLFCVYRELFCINTLCFLPQLLCSKELLGQLEVYWASRFQLLLFRLCESKLCDTCYLFILWFQLYIPLYMMSLRRYWSKSKPVPRRMRRDTTFELRSDFLCCPMKERGLGGKLEMKSYGATSQPPCQLRYFFTIQR